MEANNQGMPLGLRGIEISNFRGIRSAAIEGIPADTSWIFLTGNNGYGKSCLLQAIFLGFWGQNQDGSTILEDDPFELKFSGYQHGKIFTTLVTPEVSVKHSVNSIQVVGYGPSRLELQGLSASGEQQKSAPSYSIFNPDGILLNIERSLKDWYYRSDSKGLKGDKGKKLQKRYQEVVKTLAALMPNIARIEVDADNDKVWYTEQDQYGNPLPEKRHLSEIASGSKSILAMVGDMIIRLYTKQPDTTSVSELEGVAIIDEVDLHLHPKWQKELPRLLSNLFPKVQFIASTHSAVPFLGAPENSVFLTVDRSPEEGITIKKLELNVSDLTPNLILSSPIFGFSELFPITHTADERIRTEDTYQEKDLNDQVEQRLKAYKDSPREKKLLEIFESQKRK
jgi:predicted ATP-binding protein involved in virulence